MLLGTVAASTLGNALAGQRVIISGEGTIKAGEILMLPHPLTNFEIQKYYQNGPKFNGVYSRNNSSKKNMRIYIINHDENESIGTHGLN